MLDSLPSRKKLVASDKCTVVHVYFGEAEF